MLLASQPLFCVLTEGQVLPAAHSRVLLPQESALCLPSFFRRSMLSVGDTNAGDLELRHPWRVSASAESFAARRGAVVAHLLQKEHFEMIKLPCAGKPRKSAPLTLSACCGAGVRGRHAPTPGPPTRAAAPCQAAPVNVQPSPSHQPAPASCLIPREAEDGPCSDPREQRLPFGAGSGPWR